MMFRKAIAGLLLALGAPLLAAQSPAGLHRAPAPAVSPPWAFEHSDVAPDPAWHFGRLPNGMRYILRHSEAPKGEAVVRMQIDAGSLDEREGERGYAHFVEHMAFQGSTHVREGEMVRLLERNGLAFGADTNAFTGYENTTYHLDLPNTSLALIDTALMLMRETVSELAITPASVARERGVILSEKRDRNTWSFRESLDRYAFADPHAYYVARIPIGTDTTLNAASAEALRAFWQRNYVPAKTTLIMVGDIDVAGVEAAIRAKFGDWAPAPAAPQPAAGPISTTDTERVSIYLDPSLSEHITLVRRGPWRDEPDTWANRRKQLAAAIGYGIVNRRLQHMARRLDAPFRAAHYSTTDIFRAGRETAINIDAVDGHWRQAMLAAVTEVRRTLAQGVIPAEIAEQVAVMSAAVDTAASRDDTISSGTLAQAALNLLRQRHIPASPDQEKTWLHAQVHSITPAVVMAALKANAEPLEAPLIRFVGRRAPLGGEEGLRTAWNEASTAQLPTVLDTPPPPFAYTDFGTAGQIASDRREPGLGIREVVFANGVRLNLKHTDLTKGSVLMHLAIDGGQMLATRTNPLAVEMTGMLGQGGLGKHSLDDLQTITAGKTIAFGLGVAGDSFGASAATRPGDLLLQLQVLAALISDPGYRPEGEVLFRQNANTMFLRLRSTPGAALGSAVGGILSDGDPRFTLQPVGAFRALTFARLKADIGDRLAHGAIEIGLVGDIDEDEAIAEVARTFGALPAREPDFRSYADNRERPFTANHALRVLTHTGPKDQALVDYVWLTRDDFDPHEKQVLNLLQRIARIQMTENLRQKLGRSYSPGASSAPSRVWKNYGTFSINASVDVGSVEVTRGVIRETVDTLIATPPSADLMLRARAPLLETLDNALKTNGGWLALVSRAQTEPDQIERHLHARERLLAVTAQDVQAAARRYLAPGLEVPMVVVPQPGAPEPVPAPAPAPPENGPEPITH